MGLGSVADADLLMEVFEKTLCIRLLRIVGRVVGAGGSGGHGADKGEYDQGGTNEAAHDDLRLFVSD